ncbi:MAPEG family protein, partial [Salmonella enterica]|uniref:MAPEG family protein n=1 Tax=Salmonella enterica TaxID=28901 RepID=UPI003D2E47BE
CLKALLLGTATAAMRGKHKRFINAEDAVWLGGEAVGLDTDPGARIGRSHRNDLENLLLFAILASIYLALGGPAVAA